MLTEASEEDGSSLSRTADFKVFNGAPTITTPELDEAIVVLDVDASDTDAPGMDVDKLLAELPFDAQCERRAKGGGRV